MAEIYETPNHWNKEKINSILEKENKDMSNTTNLGNDFTTKLKEKTTNFNNWFTMSTALLNARNMFNKATNGVKAAIDSLPNLNKTEIKSVDILEIDLAKEGIDVSEWEEPVKPVKAIMSVVQKDNGETTSIEIDNMVMLMEDGTFRMNQ